LDHLGLWHLAVATPEPNEHAGLRVADAEWLQVTADPLLDEAAAQRQ
jgi:hypothetical protein